MFDYRRFLMLGFQSAVGRMADYQIILNAGAYYEKGVLCEEDLSRLQGLIDEKNQTVSQTLPEAN